MRNRFMSILRVACATGGLLSSACQTSSHKSVRTYDYRDDGRPARPERAAEDEADGEYHMVAPGEMVVDPDE